MNSSPGIIVYFSWVILGRVEDANPESRNQHLWIPGLRLRRIPE
jgi:hypothetical protein